MEFYGQDILFLKERMFYIRGGWVEGIDFPKEATFENLPVFGVGMLCKTR